MPNRTIIAGDFWCGAGGTSTGLELACKEMGFDLDLVAVNHWPIAIASHQANHPYAKQYCASIEAIDPRVLVPKRRLHLLVASPECTHHSNARGGKPMNDQSRCSAWHIIRWLELIYVDNIIIENVKEFRSWGPLGANGRPLKSKRGEFYFAFLNALRAAGYTVEDRVLNAADYGDPTTRERLFIIARRAGKKIIWPAPTHAPAERLKKASLFTQELKPWVAAREIIDWRIPGKSIFDRKKSLAPKTLQRIYAGLQKFGGPNAEPFLIVLRQHMNAQSIHEPLPTLSAGGTHVGLVQSELVPETFVFAHQRRQNPRPVSEPMNTVTATSSDFALVEPVVINMKGKSDARPVANPLPTQTTKNHLYVAQPEAFLIGRGGPEGAARPQSLNEPLNTVLTENHRAVVQPLAYTLPQHSQGELRPVNKPVSTICAAGAIGLVEPVLIQTDHHGANGGQVRSVNSPVATITTRPSTKLVEADAFLVDVNHGVKPGDSTASDAQNRSQSIHEPLRTVTAGRRGKGVVQPCVVKYNGTATAQSVETPLHTVSTKGRYALVTTEHGTYALDIRLRMLRPHELAAAMSLKDYKLTGNMEDQVRQIGNAVPVQLAKALCKQVIGA